MKLATLARGGAAILAGLTLAGAAGAQDEQKPNPQPQVKPIAPPTVDPAATIVELPNDEFRKQFRLWPQFPDSFSLQNQLLTYRKEPVFRERPILNFWRKMYAEGPLDTPASFFGESNLFGKLNPTTPHLMVYGDARTAAGYSKNQDNELARIATRLNLDIDLQMTATERIHAFIRPFEKGASIMNAEFGGADGGGGGDDFVLDAEPDTLFFEGDLGPIMQGISGVRNSKDMPFAIGKIPLFLQNGVWLEDAFVGAAFSIPAMNSPRFDVSNMDVTFFGGFDDVSSVAMLKETRNEGGNKLLGVTSFIETRSGYAEVGYGHVVNERDGPDL
ncbi:MAG TPA: hypothetical protein VK843_17885, partial [Planctomycetota bacterium]|nr:hypothetical protein [Planctomycetota bacterium]